MIEKIISGGQSGADLAGIWWAWNNRIPCEINAEMNYRPLNKEYHPNGVKVNTVSKNIGKNGGWQERRRYNVIHSDMTLIFLGKDIKASKGSYGTLVDCKTYDKPCSLVYTCTESDSIDVGIIAYRLESCKVKVLNIAGNRDLTVEQKERVQKFLSELSKLVEFKKVE